MSKEFWDNMQFKLGRDVRLFVEHFSDEEKKLLEWIKHSDDEIVFSLLSIFEGRWMTSLPAMDKWFREVFEKQDLLSYEDKEVAAILMIHEIRGYGSNTLNVFSGNTHYENILAKNHEKIAARSKLTVPKVASVRFREKSIADMLMQEALNELSAEEIQGALIGANIQPTKENTKEILKKAVAAAGVQGVSTLVGKKALKELVLDILKNYLTKQLGKKASKMVVKKIASKVAQKTFKSALGWLGVALIAKDVYDFAGEASRVTMPFVINISIYRSIENPD